MLSIRPKRDVVLVVDDEPQVLVALEDILSEDYTVRTAESAQQALDVVENEPGLAVVVTDQRMPRMSGDEFISRLPDRCSASRIMVTGYADLTAVIRAVNEGRLFAYVSKPWEPEDLRLKVARAAEHHRLLQELEEERQLLRDLMDNIPDGIYFKDRNLRFQRANAAFCGLYAADPQKVLNKTLGEFLDRKPEAEGIEDDERGLLAGGPAITDAVRAVHARGAERWISESKATVRTPSGEVIGLVGVVRDVTERRAEQERAATMGRLRSVSSAVNAVIQRLREPEALLDEVCRLLVTLGQLFSGCVLEVEGRDSKAHPICYAPHHIEPVRRLVDSLRAWKSLQWAESAMSPSGHPVVIDDLQTTASLEIFDQLQDQGVRSVGAFGLRSHGVVWLVVLCASQPGFFANERVELLLELLGSVALALDHIGQRQQVEFLSHHDPLTGLPNRRLLEARIDQQLSLHDKSRLRLALLLIDLGRFRQINDALGRAGGDQILVEASNRLQSVDAACTVARFDGNVFALLVSAVEDDASVTSLVQDKLSQVFGEPFEVDGTEVRVSVTTGIAIYPPDGARTDALISKAEVALKKAKASLQPFLFYVPSMDARVAEQITLETKLRRAVGADEFVLYYQPKVELRSGEVVGMEALIRWNDPGSGLVPPGQFIPVLEETGLIRDVGVWVLERAARQYRDWCQRGISCPRIAVNVSALQLAAADFVPRLERVLAEYPEDGAGIDLEITESVFVEDLAGSMAKLDVARQNGMSVVIDDFGTGYSSLSYLSRLPIDGLKIDRSFVARMVEDPQSTAIVTTIISLAHALELKVVAEGVETAQQAQFLRLLRCDQIQGYLVARPLPEGELPELLTKRFTPSKLPPN